MNFFQTVEEAIEYIDTIKNKKLGYFHFEEYLDSIGNPQHRFSSIHIAGTNGKGSTTNYIRSILQAHGLKVGTFTSPYLIVHNDRIRSNNHYISDEDLLRIANEQVHVWKENSLSSFEMDMCISIQYFLEQEVDVAIYEVGIGGRYDITKTIDAKIGAITNIGLDHKTLLGSTYEEVAFQKAGIIKKGMQIYTTEKKEECREIFQKEADLLGANLYYVESAHLLQSSPYIKFKYKDYEIELATFAKYQVSNAALAIDVATAYLKNIGITIKKELVEQALKYTFWKGRMEVVCEHPRIILDGAHNLEGIQALVDSMEKDSHLQILFGVFKDKEYLAMYNELKKISEEITICFFENYRAVKIEDLPKEYQGKLSFDYKKSIEEFIDKKQDLLVCGSLYFISEVRKYLKK